MICFGFLKPSFVGTWKLVGEAPDGFTPTQIVVAQDTARLVLHGIARHLVPGAPLATGFAAGRLSLVKGMALWFSILAVLLWPADRFRWNTRPATFEDVPDPSS